jgi:hypothetical protein
VAKKAANAAVDAIRKLEAEDDTPLAVEQEEEITTAKKVISELMNKDGDQKQTSCTLDSQCTGGTVCAPPASTVGQGLRASAVRNQWTCRVPSGNDCENGYDEIMQGGCANWNGADGEFPTGDDKYLGQSLTYFPNDHGNINSNIAHCHSLCRATAGCTSFVLGRQPSPADVQAAVSAGTIPYVPNGNGTCQLYRRGCYNDNDPVNVFVWTQFDCRRSPTPAPTAEPCDADYCNYRGTIGGDKNVGCTCAACTGNYEGPTCNTKSPCAANYCNGRGTIGGNQVDGCTCSACTGNYQGPRCNDKMPCAGASGNQASVTGNMVDGCVYTCQQYFKNPPACVPDCACTDGASACSSENNDGVDWCYIGANPNCADSTTHVAGSYSATPWSEQACQGNLN